MQETKEQVLNQMRDLRESEIQMKQLALQDIKGPPTTRSLPAFCHIYWSPELYKNPIDLNIYGVRLMNCPSPTSRELLFYPNKHTFGYSPLLAVCCFMGFNFHCSKTRTQELDLITGGSRML